MDQRIGQAPLAVAGAHHAIAGQVIKFNLMIISIIARRDIALPMGLTVRHARAEL